MADYTATGDPDVVNKEETTLEQINMGILVNRYIDLKIRYLNLPETKSTPDAETLDYYNAEIGMIRITNESNIRYEAQRLYNELKPIKDAGFLLNKYDDEFNQLENFINN